MAQGSWRRFWQLLVLTGALIAAQTASVAAAATGPACGATLTESLTLHADLVGCTGAGLVVGADGITIDLHGHRITGDGRTTYPGVLVQGHRGVTITGGVVRRFDAGVALVDSSGDRISRLDATDNTHFGIALINTSTSRITAVTTRRNTDFGIWVRGGAGNRLEQVTATENEFGVNFEETSRAVLTHSALSRNDLIVIGDSNRVVGNVFTDTGISLEAGSDNLIAGNRVLRAVHDGIRLSDFLPEIATAHNVVEDNTVIGAGNDGIAVATEGDGPVSDSTLRENLVIRSGQDGIHVATPSADLSGNRAVVNGRYGINAVPGVHDGGGNRATANGATPQCLNVTCA